MVDVLVCPHYGLTDVRLSLKGSEVVFGISVDELQGGTLKEPNWPTVLCFGYADTNQL